MNKPPHALASRRVALLSLLAGASALLTACGGGEDENSTPFVFTTQPSSVTVTYRGSAVGVDFEAAVSDSVKTAEWFESRDGGTTWTSLGYTGNSLALGFFVTSTALNGYQYKIKVSNYDDQFITSNPATLTVLSAA